MDIDDWRQKIDDVDTQLVLLLNERSRYAVEIGRIKQERGMEIYSPEREVQVIENVTRCNPGPLDHDAIRRLFERIIDESRRLERIAIAGDGGQESLFDQLRQSGPDVR